MVLGVQSTEAVKKVKAYDSTIKVLGFLPDVESISAFGETQADAIRLIEGWLNADTAQCVVKNSLARSAFYASHEKASLTVCMRSPKAGIDFWREFCIMEGNSAGARRRGGAGKLNMLHP